MHLGGLLDFRPQQLRREVLRCRLLERLARDRLEQGLRFEDRLTVLGDAADRVLDRARDRCSRERPCFRLRRRLERHHPQARVDDRLRQRRRGLWADVALDQLGEVLREEVDDVSPADQADARTNEREYGHDRRQEALERLRRILAALEVADLFDEAGPRLLQLVDDVGVGALRLG